MPKPVEQLNYINPGNRVAPNETRGHWTTYKLDESDSGKKIVTEILGHGDLGYYDAAQANRSTRAFRFVGKLVVGEEYKSFYTGEERVHGSSEENGDNLPHTPGDLAEDKRPISDLLNEYIGVTIQHSQGRRIVVPYTPEPQAAHIPPVRPPRLRSR